MPNCEPRPLATPTWCERSVQPMSTAIRPTLSKPCPKWSASQHIDPSARPLDRKAMVVEHVLRWAINEFLLDHDDAEEAPWFVVHLGPLLGMLKRGEIKPRIAERIALDAVA